MSLSESIKKFEERNEAELQANAIPLPGAAGEAFTTGPIQVGKWTVRKIVKFDWRVWQMTDNAIIKALTALAEPNSKVEFDDDSAAVAVWCLTHTCAEVREAMKAGVPAFKDRCVLETEAEMDMPEFNQLFESVTQQVARSCATIVKFSTQEQEGSEKIFLADSGASLKMA